MNTTFKHLSLRPLAASLLAAFGLSFSLLAAQSALADPPSGVVRLAYSTGTVSFAPAGENDWVDATVNRPLVTGDRIWADANGRADLNLNRSVLHVGADSSVSLLNLDDQVAQIQLDQGTVQLHVRQIDPSQALEIDTPNLAYSISKPGIYRIEVDPDGKQTRIALRSGEGQVYAGDQAFVLAAGRVYTFRGADLGDYDSAALAPTDEFERWADARDQHWNQPAASARYVSADMIGAEDLDAYGKWRTVPDYGPVWMPSQVASDWAPYRDGHWAWIEPWGWSWIDDAPWGFAPSHYGRWTHMNDGWGWVPGPVNTRPVYAPAVVQFVGNPGNNSTALLTVAGVAAVAWFALAPHEVYRPSYPVSQGYLNRINTSNTVVNTTVINQVYNNTSNVRNVFVNQQVKGAVVAVPSASFAQAQPVGRRALPVTAQAMAHASVVSSAQVAPVRESLLGAAPAAHDKPPAAAFARPVIARHAPPPEAAPFAARQASLAAHPGQPPATQPPAQAKRMAPVGERPAVHVVTAAATHPQALPAKPSADHAAPAVAAVSAQPPQVAARDPGRADPRAEDRQGRARAEPATASKPKPAEPPAPVAAAAPRPAAVAAAPAAPPAAQHVPDEHPVPRAQAAAVEPHREPARAPRPEAARPDPGQAAVQHPPQAQEHPEHAAPARPPAEQHARPAQEATHAAPAPAPKEEPHAAKERRNEEPHHG